MMHLVFFSSFPASARNTCCTLMVKQSSGVSGLTQRPYPSTPAHSRLHSSLRLQSHIKNDSLVKLSLCGEGKRVYLVKLSVSLHIKVCMRSPSAVKTLMLAVFTGGRQASAAGHGSMGRISSGQAEAQKLPPPAGVLHTEPLNSQAPTGRHSGSLHASASHRGMSTASSSRARQVRGKEVPAQVSAHI